WKGFPMQNSLWKLGALLGVIGVGFLVLLKAQNEMTDRQQPEESFNELTAIEDLENLDPTRTDTPEEAASAAEEYSAAPSKPTEVAATDIPEPEPTPAVDPSATSLAAAEDPGGESVNPFIDFGADPPPAGQVEPTLAVQAEPASSDW